MGDAGDEIADGGTGGEVGQGSLVGFLRGVSCGGDFWAAAGEERAAVCGAAALDGEVGGGFVGCRRCG